jgi:hypothetical protein
MILIILICIFILIYLATRPVSPKGTQGPPKAPPKAPKAPQEAPVAPVAPVAHPTEVLRLENILKVYSEDPTKWDLLITIGDIYRKGAFPRFLPNEELAMRCFKLAAMCPDGQVAGMGQSKYIETYDDPINIVDQAGKKLPTEYGIQICQVAETAIKSIPWSMFQKPREIKKPEAAQLPQLPQLLIDYKNDSQNVHDHAITKTTLSNLENLKETTKLENPTQLIKSQIDKLELDEKTKTNAIRVIDNLSSNKHSTFNTSEQDTLKMVWNKIQKQESPQLRNNLTETLVKQLASSVEYGHVVCSSGKITRIMSTLDGTLNENVARPMWAIRNELGHLATKIRNEYNNEERMRQEFQNQVKKEYVDKLGMSSKIIEPLINEYLLGF